MYDKMKCLKNVARDVENIPQLISSDTMDLFRRELEHAKRLTGLNIEIVAKDYVVDGERVDYALWLTNLAMSEVVLVSARLPHIDTYKASSVWHSEIFLRPQVAYQTGKAVLTAFEEFLKTNK
jgi:hypothetical protein